jgi:cobalt/nickel transport system permease protein
MHIPDGYLSPATCATLTTAMVPVWAVAARRVERTVKTRYVPLVALGAAYSFLVMMLNVPIPDGTTAHAVGAVLIAIVLGPWAAAIAVSIALLIQAVFFGDGGVLAFGANAFNMAFLMPFAGYGVYRLIAGRSALTAGRRALAAGVGGYVGINIAALAAAIEFGLQPTLFHAADGTPLYAPFDLSETIPAMMLAHLTVAGFVEAALTFGIVAYLQRANLPLLRANEAAPVRARRVWIGIGALVALTPLGLLAPGGAFGEDAPQELQLGKYGLDAVPSGLNRYADFWSHSVLGGYGNGSAAGYLLSAFVGLVAIALAVGAVYAVTRALRRPGVPA